MDYRCRDRGGHDCVSRCPSSGQLGRTVSRQPRERRQADERADAQGKPVCETRLLPGGLGGLAYQRHVSFRVLPADVCAQRIAQGRYIALAHHLITVVYQILSRAEVYIELGGDYYDRRNKPRVVSCLLSRLSKLGYFVELRRIAPDPPPAPELPSGRTTPASEAVSEPATIGRKRGRPCKCAERGIICKHQTFNGVNSLIQQPSSLDIFS